MGGQGGLLGAELAGADQRFQQRGGRRAHEGLSHLGPRQLREDVVTALDVTLGIAVQALGRAQNHGGRQPHEGRDADVPDPVGKIEIGDQVFQLWAVRRMDEVGAPGRPVLAQRGLNLVESPAHLGRRKPARAEESHHSCARHGDHHARGGDPARHLADHIGEAHAMGLAERTIAEPLGIDRRQGAEQGIPRAVGCHLAAKARAQSAAQSLAYDMQGLAHTRHRGRKRARVETRRFCARIPGAKVRKICAHEWGGE